MLAFGPIKKPLRPNRAFIQYFQIPPKFFCTSACQAFFSFLGEIRLKMKKTLDKRLYKKILAGVWKYCIKALLGLSGFLIGPKASTISHQKKKCIKKCPFWNPHFRAEIWCLTAWSAGKALVQKILVGNWKYCIKASIRRFYFFNRPNSGREKCNSIFDLQKTSNFVQKY